MIGETRTKIKLPNAKYPVLSRPMSLPTLRLPIKIRACLSGKETSHMLPEKCSSVCTMCHQKFARRASSVESNIAISPEDRIHSKRNFSRTLSGYSRTRLGKKLSQIKPDLTRKMDVLLGYTPISHNLSSTTSLENLLSTMKSSKPSKIREISDKFQAKILRKKLSKHTISAPILVTASSTIGTIPIQFPAQELASSERPLGSKGNKAVQLLPAFKTGIEVQSPPKDSLVTTTPHMTCELKSTKENVRALAISSFNEFYRPRYLVNTPFSAAQQTELAEESLSSFSSSGLSEFIGESAASSLSCSIGPYEEKSYLLADSYRGSIFDLYNKDDGDQCISSSIETTYTINAQ
ncbi:hypothetical protein K7432_003576 [Basidiobolus ranarum]|uniref:Uncharacterized protein n=1 Tax=Basidiobolus ranarum TaxID=34480 RepID=A0ABR2WZT4_9FUNG